MKPGKTTANSDIEILVVEDSPTQAEQLRHLLNEHGYKVTVAANGKEAITAMKKRKPAILISDILMPEMDGYALCEKVKSDEKLKDIPVILLTSLSSVQDVVRGLQSGADNFIRKPYDGKYLLSRIHYILVSQELRRGQKMHMGVEIYLGGQKHFIACERQQIVDLLISIYEEAIHMNEELKVRQKELSRSNQVLNGLYRIAEGLNRCTSEQEVVDKTLAHALELPDIKAGWVVLQDGESVFRIAATRNMPPALEVPGAMDGDCNCRRQLDSGELDQAVNILECERLKKVNGDTYGLRYHASVPLWIGDRRLGVINLAGTDLKMFSEEDLKTLHGVGHQVAVALERAQLIEDLEQIVEDRTEALRDSEEWFRAIFNSQMDAVLVVSPDRRILNTNIAAEHMFGYSNGEMRGQSTKMLHVDRDHYLSFGERIREALVKGESVRFEFELKRKSGEIFPAEQILSHLINDRGKSVGIVGALRDITERKRMEKERSRLISILEATTDFVGIADAHMRALYLNQAGRKILGVSENEDIAGFPIPEAHPQWVRETILNEGIPTAIREGVWTGETALLSRTGREIPVSQVILAHKASDGTIEFISTIARDISDRKQAEEKVKYMAYYDPLTGLPNRALLNDRLKQAILSGQRESNPLALLIMDLNNFKEINDTLGHHKGDLLLQQVGARVRGVLRESDTVARMGGDEFAVLLPSAGSVERSTLAMRKMLKALEQPFALEGLALDVAVSIGIALCPEHGEDADLLIQRADVAMYVAKQSGINYAVYVPEHDRHSPRRLALMGELRHAIENDQLFLLYQPKIDLQRACAIGVEALVRWRHPHHGIIPPDEFIPLAERSGVIKSLTLWVLGEALRQCRTWSQGGVQLSMAMNLSARNLQDPQLPDRIAELLQTSGLAPGWLELEITESAIMVDPVRAMEILTRLRAMGIRFSIDDFGTGYSSLGYLKKLPVDEIKIDRSFVIGMAANENDAVIVRSTIDLAHNLGLKVVAEGVENQETLDRLIDLGCDAAQGYYMSRPIPPAELTRWLTESPWGLGSVSGEPRSSTDQ